MGARNILITGGFGNLGSWLTDAFCRAGDRVTVLARRRPDELGPDGAPRPLLADLDLEFVAGDVTSLASCRAALADRRFDAVIHAASVNDGFVPNYFHDALTVNALGTRNLLEALPADRVGHLVYVSTFQVYGRYAGAIDEATELATQNDYGLTHLFAEQYVRQHGRTKRLPFTILRLTNSYGCPKDVATSKWYLVLNDLARMAVERRELALKSNGQVPRDFIWMGDVCAVLRALVAHGPTGEVFNLAGEATSRMLDVAHAVRDAYRERYGVDLPVRVNEDDRTTYPDGLRVSAQKLKALIQYDARPRFREEALAIFDLVERMQAAAARPSAAPTRAAAP